MKKLPFLFILLLVVTISFSGCDKPSNVADQCVRIHIRANSDSPEDQAVKLKVRDEVCKYLEARLCGVKSKADALSVLDEESAKLVDIANRTLYLYNFEYKASIRISNEHFPERAYGEYVFPEDDYDAVVIELGDGGGANWWCVAFPPLCFLPEGNGEKPAYRSWVKEQLDKIFGDRA